MDTLTHEQIMATTLCALPTGEIVGSQDGFRTFQTVFTPNTVRTEYRHLLQASALLYSVVDDTEKALEDLIAILESVPSTGPLADPIIAVVANMRRSKEIAVDGLAAVAARQVGSPEPSSPTPPPASPKKRSNIIDFFRSKGVDRPKSSD